MRKSRNLLRSLVAAAALAIMAPLAFVPASADTGTDVASGQLALTGSTGQHDPTLYTDGDMYYVAATHGAIYSSPTLNGDWKRLGSVERADWTREGPFSNQLWAPHVQKVGDTFYYYYSTTGGFGSNDSAVGLKTTKTPGDPSSYVDHGAPIVASGAAATHPDLVDDNAIDPAVLQDADGTWWLVWGSHFDGIMMQELADDMVTVSGEIYELADRASAEFPVTNPSYNRIEGPALFERDGYYYLLVAWDWCCRANGNDNTYKIVVGRSESINGPYVDKNGVDLAEGGGTIILNSRVAQEEVTPDGLHRAPGGPDMFVEDGTYYMVYHSYRPGTVMGIRPMDWHGGWPYFQEDGDSYYNLQDGGFYRLINQAGHIADPDSLQNPQPSDRCLTAEDDGNVVQATCDDVLEQYWRLSFEDDGFFTWQSLGGEQDRCLTMAAPGDGAAEVFVTDCDERQAHQEWYFDDTGHGFHRVVANANLALEIENVNGDLGTEVVGEYRRDGDHQAGNLTQAAKWPPQQWRLDMVPVVQLSDAKECKKGGWKTSEFPTFRNQGQCVSHFRAGK